MDNTQPEIPQKPIAPSGDIQQPQQSTTVPGSAQSINSSVVEPNAQQPIVSPDIPPVTPTVGNFGSGQIVTSNGKNRRGLFLGIGIAAVIIVVAVILVLSLNSKKPAAKTQQAAASKSSTSGSQKTSSNTAGNSLALTQSYSDTMISLKYPSGWQVIPTPNYSQAGNFYNIVPANVSAADAMKDNSGLNVQDDTFPGQSDLGAQQFYQTNFSPNATVVSQNTSTVDGYPAYSIKSSGSQGEEQEGVIDNKGVYIYYHYAQPDTNTQTYQAIINSVTFKS